MPAALKTVARLADKIRRLTAKITVKLVGLSEKLLTKIITTLTLLAAGPVVRLAVIRAMPVSPEAVETGIVAIRRLPELIGAIVSAIIVFVIGYAVTSQVQGSLNITPPGSSMLNTVWTFIPLMIFAAAAAVIVGFFTGGRR
jgi:hypothetical protein